MNSAGPSAHPPMPVAGYVRVSTTSQADRETPQDQKARIREYAESHGWELVQIYEDAMTGTTTAREGLLAMLEDAHQGRWEAVLVRNPSRLGRAEEFEMMGVRAALKRAKVQLIDLNTGQDLARDDRATDLIFAIGAIEAKWSRVDMLEITRAGKRREVAKGHFGGGRVPYGYDHDRNHRQLTVNEEEAKVVRSIFRMTVEEDLSTLKIARILNSTGKLSKMAGRTLNKRTGKISEGKWTDSQVAQIVRNRLYTGQGIWGRRQSAGRDKLAPVNYPVPPIISLDVYEKALANLRSRQRFRGPINLGKYELRGMIRCGKCGRTYVGITQGGRGRPEYRYYRCTGVSHKVDGQRCSARSIRADAIERATWDLIAGVLGNEDYLMNFARSLVRADPPITDADFAELSRSRVELNTQRENLVSQLGRFTPETSEIIAARIREIEEGLQTLDERETSFNQALRDFHASQEHADSLAALIERVRAGLASQTVADRIEVYHALLREILVVEDAPDPGQRTFAIFLRGNVEAYELTSSGVPASPVGGGRLTRDPDQQAALAGGRFYRSTSDGRGFTWPCTCQP